MFAAAALGATACASSAAAAPESLRQGLFGRDQFDSRQAGAPPVARYVAEDGAGFIVDRSQGRVLLKFDDDPEVWALLPQAAPRGDVIYKNDLGEPVLRATRLGGLTVFTHDRPGGSAAALVGGGAALRLQPLAAQALLERLAQASARASRAAKRLIAFDADASPTSAALIADAANIVSAALVRVSRRGDGRAVLSRVKQVRLAEGKRPDVKLSQGELQVTVAPAHGLAGRPSSDRILAVAANEH